MPFFRLWVHSASHQFFSDLIRRERVPNGSGLTILSDACSDPTMRVQGGSFGHSPRTENHSSGQHFYPEVEPYLYRVFQDRTRGKKFRAEVRSSTRHTISVERSRPRQNDDGDRSCVRQTMSQNQ